MASPKPLPNRIRELREKRQWTVRQLAERAGTDTSSTFRREAGETDDLRPLRKIAKAFGVKLSELLNAEDVEYRADEGGRAVIAELEGIPPEERADVLAMAHELVRVARVMASQRSSAALGGDPRQIGALADIWNSSDHAGRQRAIELLRVARLD